MKWFLIRHGEIRSNRKNIYAGWSEEGLTRKGTRQAKKAARQLLSKGIDAIYCSPLKRAVQTAEIIGDNVKIKPVVNKNFKELNLGIWEGLTEGDVREQYPKEWMIWLTRPAELCLDGREKLTELQNRVIGGIEKIRVQRKNGSVLIVTHVAVIRILLLYAKKLDLNCYKIVPVPNTTVFEIEDHLINGKTSFLVNQRSFYAQGILNGSGSWHQAEALNG